eukprot:TRINITY_DN76673_c0_g1_i1.p1 TRINITY_DN76673_c0_g1~~TRINITY_DN76673_c0_g1_i1.p1  ORF type:complete len:330 (-),score=81.96 TRINITY_DN76673_c0_g1_i1:241-1230(-)
MPRVDPGILELSYARSAGSGDQPVVGLVTSRRDRGKQQRFKELQLQREEQDRLEKERTRAAKLMRRRWQEEDKEKRRVKKGEEEKEKDKERDEEKHGLSRDEGQLQRSTEVDDALQERDVVPRSRGDEGRGRVAVPRSRTRSRPRAGGSDFSGWQQAALEEEVLQQMRVHDAQSEPRGSSGSSSSGWVSLDRGGAPNPAGTSATAPAASVAQEQSRPIGKSGKSSTKAVFGFGIDDEEDGRRELELLAEKQRMRAQKHTSDTLALGDERNNASIAAPSQTAPVKLDAYQQLKKLADWKRSCAGERRPMPKEMMDDLYKVAERQGGRHIT